MSDKVFMSISSLGEVATTVVSMANVCFPVQHNSGQSFRTHEVKFVRGIEILLEVATQKAFFPACFELFFILSDVNTFWINS